LELVKCCVECKSLAFEAVPKLLGFIIIISHSEQSQGP